MARDPTFPPRELPVFDRQLIEYLPTVMRDVEELQQIMAAEQPEVFDLWEAVQRVLDEQFIGTMSDYGVGRWEKILRITPGASETLDERKERILLILRIKLPFTIRWLRQWLADNIGAGGFHLDINLYTIEIWLHYDRINKKVYLDVLDLLGWVRPQDMVIGITGQREVDGLMKLGAYPEMSSTIEVDPVATEVVGPVLLGCYVEIQQIISVGG